MYRTPEMFKNINILGTHFSPPRSTFVIPETADWQDSMPAITRPTLQDPVARRRKQPLDLRKEAGRISRPTSARPFMCRIALSSATVRFGLRDHSCSRVYNVCSTPQPLLLECSLSNRDDSQHIGQQRI